MIIDRRGGIIDTLPDHDSDVFRHALRQPSPEALAALRDLGVIIDPSTGIKGALRAIRERMETLPEDERRTLLKAIGL